MRPTLKYQSASEKLLECIIKTAQQRKHAVHPLSVFLDSFAKQMESRIISSLSKPEMITSNIAFSDSANDAQNLLKVMWNIHRGKQSTSKQPDKNPFAEDSPFSSNGQGERLPDTNIDWD